MHSYSVIIPVFNRPEEIRELLESLVRQSTKPFEVVVVDDGSTVTCEEVVKSFSELLDLVYLKKENSGQGFSRNYGFEKASGDYFVVFDSDCILPDNYFEQLDIALSQNPLDAFGGPDRAGEDFTAIQKAITYSMTSAITTGGIRGNRRRLDAFHPRSFNMGISREVWNETKGYKITRMGEDIEFSLRVAEAGFKTGLIENVYVYHKRRTSFWQFFKQLRFFGRARINVSRFYPNEIKFVHLLPLLFLIFQVMWVVGAVTYGEPWVTVGLAANVIFSIIVLIHASFTTKNLWVGILGVIAAYIQLLAYGTGLLTEGMVKIFRGWPSV